MPIPPIRVVIQGVDRFSSTIGKSMAKLEKMGKGMQSAGRRASMMVTAPIVAGGFAVVKTAAKFEASMNKVEALTGAGAEGMRQMRDMAKDLGIRTKFSASEAADAMSFLGMAGWETNQILAGTPALLDLAASSGIELGRAADITSNIMGAFRLDAGKAGEVADVLAATTSSANVDMEMLAETMSKAAPIAASAGASLRDVAAGAGFLGNVGIQGSIAGTALKNMFVNLAGPAGAGAKMLDAMGISVMDANRNMRPMAGILADLSKKMASLGTADKLTVMKTLFGKISLAGATALVDDIGNANSGFLKLAKNLENVDGRANRMAETMQKGAAGAFTKLQAALEGFAIALGDTGLLDFVTRVILKFTDFFQRAAKLHPRLMKIGLVIAAIVAAIGPLLVVGGMLINALAIIGAKVAAAGGIIALISNPIGWAIAAIAAIIAILKIAGLKWTEIFRLFMASAGFFMIPVVAIVEWVIENWKRLLPFFKLLFLTIGFLFQKFVGIIKPILSPFLWLLEKIIGAIKKVLSFGLGTLEKIAGKLLPKELQQKIGLVQESTQSEAIPTGAIKGLAPLHTRSETIVKFQNPPEGTSIERVSGDMEIETTRGGLLPALGG